jgi:hypothetical protein
MGPPQALLDRLATERTYEGIVASVTMPRKQAAE